MATGAGRIVDDLHRLLADLESLAARAKDTAEEPLDGRVKASASRMAELIGSAQQRLKDLGADLGRRAGGTARAADTTVRDSPWAAVGIAAGAAFLLGFALGRGSPRADRAFDDESG